MLIVTTIPVVAEATIEGIKSEKEKTSGIGWTFLRGWVYNPIERKNIVHAKAIWLHYRERSFLVKHVGVLRRYEDISFRNGPFIYIYEFGEFGSLAYVFGFYYHR